MKTRLHSLSIAIALIAGAHQIAAQNTVVTYQGVLTDKGTHFSGTGRFQFVLIGPGQQATAIAIVDHNIAEVSAVNVINGGSGYTTAPSVIFPDNFPHTTASATAVISGGAVTGIVVTGGGAYFGGAPSVTISPPTGMASYWSNDGMSVTNSEPVTAVSVPVTNGLFTVTLGDTNLANMNAIPASIFTNQNLQLQIWFSDGVNGFSPLNPPQQLAAAPYAALAVNANNLLGTVSSTALTSVPAGNLTGSIADARLSANVALRAGGNTFTGNQTIASGNVGIGTATPAYQLTVQGSGNEVYSVMSEDGTQTSDNLTVQIAPGGGSSTSRIGYLFGNFGNSSEGFMIANMRNAPLRFGTGGGPSEAMRIAYGGNVGIGTTAPGALLQVGSATCNGTTWQNASDRALKEHFDPVCPQTVLEKVVALPITEWDYKQDSGTKHVGPMAQDFHAAFGLNGADDRHIATVDEEGVALVAIQGLNQKLNERDAEIEKLKAKAEKVDSLEKRLIELEQLVQSRAQQK